MFAALSSPRSPQAMQQVSTPRRLALTGYPLQNNLEEYFAMISWAQPDLLGTQQQFRAEFATIIRKGGWKLAGAGGAGSTEGAGEGVRTGAGGRLGGDGWGRGARGGADSAPLQLITYTHTCIYTPLLRITRTGQQPDASRADREACAKKLYLLTERLTKDCIHRVGPETLEVRRAGGGRGRAGGRQARACGPEPALRRGAEVLMSARPCLPPPWARHCNYRIRKATFNTSPPCPCRTRRPAPPLRRPPAPPPAPLLYHCTWLRLHFSNNHECTPPPRPQPMLPPKSDVVLFLDMTPRQRAMYTAYLRALQGRPPPGAAGGTGTSGEGAEGGGGGSGGVLERRLFFRDLRVLGMVREVGDRESSGSRVVSTVPSKGPEAQRRNGEMGRESGGGRRRS